MTGRKRNQSLRRHKGIDTNVLMSLSTLFQISCSGLTQAKAFSICLPSDPIVLCRRGLASGQATSLRVFVNGLSYVQLRTKLGPVKIKVHITRKVITRFSCKINKEDPTQ